MKADGREPVEREEECSRERERNRPKIARVRLSCVEKGAQGWDGRTGSREGGRGEHPAVSQDTGRATTSVQRRRGISPRVC